MHVLDLLGAVWECENDLVDAVAVKEGPGGAELFEMFAYAVAYIFALDAPVSVCDV